MDIGWLLKSIYRKESQENVPDEHAAYSGRIKMYIGNKEAEKKGVIESQ